MKVINKYNGQGITVTTIKRSGSTYLVYMLSHIFTKYKFFQERRNDESEKETMKGYTYYFNENLKYTNSKKYQNYIVKTFANRKYNLGNIFGTYNIFLIRKNIFNGVLSQIYSEMEDIWCFSNNTKFNKITVDIEFFNQALKERIKILSLLIDNKEKHNMILLWIMKI